MRFRTDHAGKEGLRTSRPLLPSIFAGILLGMAFNAPAEIVWKLGQTHTSATTTGTGKAIATSQKDVAVQVCGTGVTGTVIIKQGAREATLTTTKTITLTGYTGCSEYYDLRRSSVVRIDITQSAGAIDSVDLEIPK